MKKGLVIVLAGLLVLGLSGLAMAQGLSDSQTFNFSCTVEKYIEVNPAYETITTSITIPGHGLGGPPGHSHMFPNYKDAVYANCPFTISCVGNNAANDGRPILARQEVNGNGYDRLQTRITIRSWINTFAPGYEYHETEFTSPAEGVVSGRFYPPVITFTNAPHDGEVNIKVELNASLPHKSPDFGSDNTWDQSADAGEYSAWVDVTYTAL